MATKRLIEFTQKSVPEGNDVVYANDKNIAQEVKVPFSGVKTYVLDGKKVGGTAPGDIVNIDSAQTLTNKRLNSPGINDTSAVMAKSAELNILHGATITTQELNRLQGVTDNIQAQLNALSAVAYDVRQRTYTYGTGTITGVGSQIITDSALVHNTGLAGWYTNPDSITVSVYELQSNQWVLQAPISPIKVAFSTRTVYMTTVLNQIEIALSDAKSYKIVVTYKIMQTTGV